MLRSVILALFLTFAICSDVLSAPVFSEGYRDVKWGMSLKEVKSYFSDYEFRETVAGEPYIEDEILGIEFKVGFDFYEDNLKRVILYSEVKNMLGTAQEVTSGIGNFEELRVALNGKYGQHNKIMKKIPEFFTAEQAIELGQTRFTCLWNTPESTITLSLGKSGGMMSPVALVIVYSSDHFSDLEKKKSSESKL